MRWVAWSVMVMCSMAWAEGDGSSVSKPKAIELPRIILKPGKVPRQVQTKEECYIGEECILPDGTTFQVNQGPTPRLDRLWTQYKELERAGVNDPDFLKELGKFREKMEAVDPSDLTKLNELDGELAKLEDLTERMARLERDYGNLRSEYRPFRIGAAFSPPIGEYSALTVGVQWQPPRLTEKLHLLFGAGFGAARFGEIPAEQKVRALFDGSATLNMWLGQGKAFLGLAMAVASDPFSRSWVGGGPTGGYRWNWNPELSLDFSLTVPYAKSSWEEAPGWGLETQLALMWQFGGSGDTRVAAKQ